MIKLFSRQKLIELYHAALNLLNICAEHKNMGETW